MNEKRRTSTSRRDARPEAASCGGSGCSSLRSDPQLPRRPCRGGRLRSEVWRAVCRSPSASGFRMRPKDWPSRCRCWAGISSARLGHRGADGHGRADWRFARGRHHHTVGTAASMGLALPRVQCSTLSATKSSPKPTCGQQGKTTLGAVGLVLMLFLDVWLG